MNRLDNNQLIEAYIKAIDLNLAESFINFLIIELNSRGIDPEALD